MLSVSVSPRADEQLHAYTCLNFPLTLNEVTLATQIKWGAQAYLAPELLEEIVPLYAYPMSAIDIIDFEEHFNRQVESRNAGHEDYRFGAAVIQVNDMQNDWLASPLASITLETAADAISSFYTSCTDNRNGNHDWYMVTDLAITGLIEQAEILWATKSELAGS